MPLQLHAIVEPYDQSFFSEKYESDDICRRYGSSMMQVMMCVGEAYDSKPNEAFVIIGELFSCSNSDSRDANMFY